MLIDTGSSLNLISSDVFQNVNIGKLKNCYMPILTATGDKVLLDKCVCVKFQLNNRCFEENFYVMPGANAHSFVGILGMPFLTANKAIIYCEKNSLGFEGGEGDMQYKDITQKPQSIVTISQDSVDFIQHCSGDINIEKANEKNENDDFNKTKPKIIDVISTGDKHNNSNLDKVAKTEINTNQDDFKNEKKCTSEYENRLCKNLDPSTNNINEVSGNVNNLDLDENKCDNNLNNITINVDNNSGKVNDERNDTYFKSAVCPGYIKSKVIIPSGSRKLAQLKCNKMWFQNKVEVVVEPIRDKLRDGILASRTICSSEHGIFISLINFSDEDICLNKNLKIADLILCKNNNSPDLVNLCANINNAENPDSFDHADLSWDSDIKLDHLDPEVRSQVEAFLENNKDVFASSVLDLPGCDTVPHTIPLKDDKPVRSKAYRLAHHLRQELDSQLDMLLEADIISPSISEFASPVVLVKKACGQYRLAVDFRKLNKNLAKDSFPIPNITDSIDALAGSEYFSTLDLTSGFFQQIITPEDTHKTAIITHRGLYEFKRSPFGMSNSSNNFQRLMNVVFGNLAHAGILVYIDDIVVSSKDIASHLEKLNAVFSKLREHKLRLKPSKCTFLSTSIQYLGFQISKGQVAPINKNVEVIKNFQVPNSRRALRSFLGTINFYRRHIPDFSKRALHLTELTKDNGKFCWTEEAQKEFEDLKEALLSKPCLALPDFSKEFQIYTDASGQALGAVLMQLDESDAPHPVAFASRKLKGAETRYSTTERELLALVWATAHFKCYLANSHFVIFTDHAPLTYMLKIKDPTSRMAKWICILSDFEFTVKYVKGKCNGVADFLSRYVNNSNDMINFIDISCNVSNEFVPQSDLLENIGKLQKSDTKCIEIANKIAKNLNIAPNYLKFSFEHDLLVCEDTTEVSAIGNLRKLVVPREMILQVFNLTHDSMAGCHQGYQKTLDRIREHFYWPGMTVDIRNLVDSCISCQERRAHKAKQLAPLQRMPTPSSPFQVVHVDILGPLPKTLSENRFIITYIDAFTKWPEAYPVKSAESDIIAETLADFISRHGSPSRIISDNGRNLTSDDIEIVYKNFGIKHVNTTPYHPASNGQVERSHKTLINALAHIVDENQLDWDIKLKFALLAMRTSVHSSTRKTPAAVVYGRNLNLPYKVLNDLQKINYSDAPSFCDLLIPSMQKVYADVYDKLVKVAEQQEKYRDKTAVVKDIEVGDSCWLYNPSVGVGKSRKLAKLNVGPFLVVQKMSEVNFKIASEHNLSNTQVVHVDRLQKVVNRMDFPNTEEGQASETEQESGSQEPSSMKEDSVRDPQVVDKFIHPKRRNRRFFWHHKFGNTARKQRVVSGRHNNTRYYWRKLSGQT